MARIFAGIQISDGARSALAKYIGELRKEFRDFRVTWEKEEKLHLTLKFFGEVDEKDVELISQAAVESAASISRFELSLNGTGVFPSRRNARVLWIGIEDSSKMFSALQRKFEDECARRGFAHDKRDFNPHLTIARLRESAPALVGKHLNTEFPRSNFEVSELIIFESKLSPNGSTHFVISRHKLSGAS